MRNGIAEIDQDAIAVVLRNRAFVRLTAAARGVAIVRDDFAKIFRDRCCESSVDPTRSQNMNVMWRRSMAALTLVAAAVRRELLPHCRRTWRRVVFCVRRTGSAARVAPRIARRILLRAALRCRTPDMVASQVQAGEGDRAPGRAATVMALMLSQYHDGFLAEQQSRRAHDASSRRAEETSPSSPSNYGARSGRRSSRSPRWSEATPNRPGTRSGRVRRADDESRAADGGFDRERAADAVTRGPMPANARSGEIIALANARPGPPTI